MLDELIISGFLLLGAFYWLSSQRVRELALHATKSYCLNAEVQLLDEYVALNHLWLVRDKTGQLKIQRRYQFEFSSTGNERYNGVCTMLGQQLESIQLEAYRINES